MRRYSASLAIGKCKLKLWLCATKHTLELLRQKIMTPPSAGNWDSHALIGMQNGTPLWKIIWQFLRKLYIHWPCDPAVLLLGIHQWSENLCSLKNLYMNVHNSFTWWPKPGNSPGVLQRMNRSSVVHSHNEIALSSKSSEHTTWMKLKDVTLSEASQGRKVLYYLIPFIWHSWKDETIVLGNRPVVARGGAWRWSFVDQWVVPGSFLVVGTVMYLLCGGSYTNIYMYWNL